MSLDQIKVMFLHPSGGAPSTRYRVHQIIPRLVGAGITAAASPIPSGSRARWRLFRSARNFDIVVLQKKLLTAPDFTVLRKASKVLVYDFDDAIMYRDTGGAAAAGKNPNRASFTRSRRFRRTVRRADFLLAGNSYLRTEAIRYGARESNVAVVPTCLDTDVWQPGSSPKHQSDSRLVVGWMGTGNSLSYMQPLRSALQKLAQIVPDLELHIVCDRFIDVPGMSVQNIAWSQATEVETAQRFDIGLAPLADNSWTRGKCAFKTLTYMALALPVVCSPVGANLEVVIDGQNGLFARSTDEWVDKLTTLCRDSELREHLGRGGRQTVIQRYSLDAVVPRYHRLFSGFVKQGRDTGITKTNGMRRA